MAPSRALTLTLLCLAACSAAGTSEIMKGMCYGPAPLKGLPSEVGANLPTDDFMAESMKGMWGPRGRGDLQLMRTMGVNTVRLYGNDPRESHRAFLDEAYSLGLDVVPGLSDWPFMQMTGNCIDTNYNCYTQVKEYYLERLQNGWLMADGSYHPAIKQVVVMNEPDLKMGNLGNPDRWTKALASAIDGMLEAEKLAGVSGTRVNFTATFSFGVCLWCSSYPAGTMGTPGLLQMTELRAVMRNPSSAGYAAPKNNLGNFYDTRFTNSFNTQNPSTDMRSLILDKYEANFKTTPIFIGEFHAGNTPGVDQTADLANMVTIATNSPLLLGFAFFEWQVRQDKGGSEMNFGMFSLGDFSIAPLIFDTGERFDAWCLVPVSGLADAVSSAFGGVSPNMAVLCRPDPNKVPLNETGFQRIRGLANAPDTQAFVARAVRHAGGAVTNSAGLATFASSLSSFAVLVDALLSSRRASLTWASFDALAACRADRLSDATAVGRAIEKACSKTWFNCANLPAACSGDVWSKADYVFSVFYNEQGASPLGDCYYDGSATLELPAPMNASCIVTKVAATTTLTDEGYQAVLSRQVVDETAAFISRVALEEFGAVITDAARIRTMAESPPASMFDLRAALVGADWLCTGEGCQPVPSVEPLTNTALQKFRAHGDVSLIAEFLERAVAHFGGTIVDAAAYRSFAAAAETMQETAAALVARPGWASWDVAAACRFDGANLGNVTLGLSVEYACSLTWFNCGSVPAECTHDFPDTVDYVLSEYESERGAPLPSCYYKDALVFSHTRNEVSPCIVSRDPATTPITEEGYQAIVRLGRADAIAKFIRRVIRELLNASPIDARPLASMAANPPGSLFDVVELLRTAQWLCFNTVEACTALARNANLTSDGFQIVLAQESTELMVLFVSRVAAYHGGHIVDGSALAEFANMTISALPPLSFEQLVARVARRPVWALWDPEVACVLDRSSSAANVGLTLEFACDLTWFNCANIPDECRTNSWDSADYVLSVYFNERADQPLPTCFYKGSLIFARASVGAWDAASICVVTQDPLTTPLTDEGYQAIVRQHSAEKLAEFVHRFANERLAATLMDEVALWGFASEPNPPKSLRDLEAALVGADWLCFSSAGHACVQSALEAPLTQDGFSQVLSQGNATMKEQFVRRVVDHYAGEVVNESAFRSFVSGATTLQAVVNAVDASPSWARWNESLACIAEDARPSVLAASAASLSVEKACFGMVAFDCESIPQECRGSVWDKADYALSVYAFEHEWAPLPTCFYHNSLIYARPRPFTTSSSGCVVTDDPETTALTEEGYQAILRSNASAQNAIFIRRVLVEKMRGRVSDQAGLIALAENPPTSFLELEVELWKAPWTSIPLSGRGALADPTSQDAGQADFTWRFWAFVGLGGLVATTLLGTVLWVIFHRESVQQVMLPGGSSVPPVKAAEKRPDAAAVAGP